MNLRRSTHLLLLVPTIALGLTFATTAVVHAQDASLTVTFGHTPRWVGVRGTRVREIRPADRPDYDMFSYGGRYYAYRDNRWYWSRRSRGHFQPIEDRRVPREISRVPRDHWHNYPSGWGDPNAPAHPTDDMHHH